LRVRGGGASQAARSFARRHKRGRRVSSATSGAARLSRPRPRPGFGQSPDRRRGMGGHAAGGPRRRELLRRCRPMRARAGWRAAHQLCRSDARRSHQPPPVASLGGWFRERARHRRERQGVAACGALGPTPPPSKKGRRRSCRLFFLYASRAPTPCSRTSSRVFFSATSSPVFLSRALYTLPYVPSPIFSSFSYASIVWLGVETREMSQTTKFAATKKHSAPCGLRVCAAPGLVVPHTTHHHPITLPTPPPTHTHTLITS
jgi:hypothetical protein